MDSAWVRRGPPPAGPPPPHRPKAPPRRPFAWIRLGCGGRRRRRSAPFGIAQMPPATEGVVELNDHQPAIEFRLRQGVFGGNQLLLRLQNLEIAGLASQVTLLRDFHRGLKCLDRFYLAIPDGLQFLARDEQVRNIAKRGQRRNTWKSP